VFDTTSMRQEIRRGSRYLDGALIFARSSDQEPLRSGVTSIRLLNCLII